MNIEHIEHRTQHIGAIKVKDNVFIMNEKIVLTIKIFKKRGKKKNKNIKIVYVFEVQLNNEIYILVYKYIDNVANREWNAISISKNTIDYIQDNNIRM